MNDIIKKHKAFVANQIEKSFDGGINVSSNYIEKAKWKIGDEKQYQGATWVVGGFNAKGTPLWRKKKDGGGSATPAQSTSEKSWDKQDSFNRRGTDENKLWNLWYHHQNTGDPFHVSAMVDILKKKFPNVAEFVQTAPNTGKSTITAKDSSGNEIATIDLSGNKTSIPTLQTFMDKCSAAVKAPAKKTSNAISKFVDKIFELKEASEKAESEYKAAYKKYDDEFSETDEFKNFQAFQTKVAGMDDEEYKKYWDEEDKLLAAYQKKDKEIQNKYNVPQLEHEYYHVADKKYRDHFFGPDAYNYMKTLMDKKNPSEKEKEAIKLYTKVAWNPD